MLQGFCGQELIRSYFMLLMLKVLQYLVIYQGFGGIMWILQLVLVCKTNKGISSTSSSYKISGNCGLKFNNSEVQWLGDD